MATKYLLIDDVEHLGRAGDVVTARPGYARNYLIPQGFAVVADKRALAMQTRLQKERHEKALKDKAESEEIAAKLHDVILETIVKVDHEGHMYGSVSQHDIQILIEKATGIHLERRSVVLKHALKEIGVHAIPIKLKEGVAVETLTLKIVPEEASTS